MDCSKQLAALKEIEETLDAMLGDETIHIDMVVGAKLEALSVLTYKGQH